MDSDMNDADDGDRCRFCNAKRDEPCGLEKYDEHGRPQFGSLPCATVGTPTE